MLRSNASPRIFLFALALLFATSSLALSGEWLGWRGPNRNGVAEEGKAPVTSWSDNQNIVWKTPVPGRGHSSPIVVGNQIVLTTADEQNQSQAVVSFDRATGKQLWITEVSRGGFPPRIHNKNTHASPTVASDGKRLFASFNSQGNVNVAALSLQGEIEWRTVIGPYQPKRYEYGYAPSPLLYKSTLITCADYEQGWLAALDTATGKPLWKTQRPSGINYASPVVATVADRDQLLLSGMEQIISYDPATGKQLWSANRLAPATCGTAVWDAQNIYASGGYPKSETAAVAGDGSGRVLWTNREKCYEQSMLLHDGYLYAVNDNGIAFCWRAIDGNEMWKTRLGGPVSASPVLAGGNIYYSDERGTTYVFKATPESYQEVSQNRLGDETFASPAVVEGKIFLRVADSRQGGRQEYLVCIGE